MYCFNRANGIDKKDLIQYKGKKTNNRVPFVITYHPALSNLSNQESGLWGADCMISFFKFPHEDVGV
jgi:hypothetical protein